jgi:hypothetical protein
MVWCTYGDELLVSLNLKDVGLQVINGIAESQGITPGSPEYEELYNRAIPYFPDQLVTRTGWIEKDLSDDKTNNLRFGGSFHYFINERTEAIAQANYAQLKRIPHRIALQPVNSIFFQEKLKLIIRFTMSGHGGRLIIQVLRMISEVLHFFSTKNGNLRKTGFQIILHPTHKLY